MNTAQVVIIGGGVIGASIAYHLATMGCRDVIILEKETIGSGATEKCAGGIRQQFSTAANIRLSMESVKFFERFEDETGHAADFRQYGYLMMATNEEEISAFHRNITLQHTLGLEVELLSPEEVLNMVPCLNVNDVRGATFCRTDGFADPYSVVNGFASATRRLGVKVYENTEVTGIEVKGDKVEGVITTTGKYATPVVVNAAGAYAKAVGKMTNLDIPVSPKRRHLFVTGTVSPLKIPISEEQWQRLPMVVDYNNGFWFRREGSCLIFGMRNPDEVESFDISVDWDYFVKSIGPTASYRLPIIDGLGIGRWQVGLHPDTPDDMAILGHAPNIEGMYLACGLGGHGFMHSPAVGRLMAELILGRIKSLPDAECFNLERFAQKGGGKEEVAI